MTTTTLSDAPSTPSFAVRGSGYAIAAGVVVLFAFYGTYFVQMLVMLSPEQVAMAEAARGASEADSMYPFILSIWQIVAGPSLIAARTLSLLASVLAIVIAFSIARRLSGDMVMAAFLVLPFVLYPPLVATWVSATPHALFLLCAFGAFALLQRAPHGAAVPGAGALVFIATLLHPLGLVVMPVWALFIGLILYDRRALVVFAFAVIAAVGSLIIGLGAVADADVAAAGHDTILKALALPYAMVIVGTGLSVIAALSRQTRSALGLRNTLTVLAGPVLGAGILLAVHAADGLTVGQFVTAAGYVFPLAFLAPWPLIYWVRHVMPQVKNIVAWISFPVIMYSCFWVVLGPVDPHRFPYSHRHIEQPLP